MTDQIENADTPTSTTYNVLIKHKLSNVCHADKFCGICLENVEPLWPLNTVFDITINESEKKKLLSDVISYVFGDEWEEMLSSGYICSYCIQKSIQSYLFIYNTKEMSKMLNHYIEDLTSKMIDVNDQLSTYPLYENSNILIVLDRFEGASDYVDVTSSTVITATESSNMLKVKENKVRVLELPKVVNSSTDIKDSAKIAVHKEIDSQKTIVPITKVVNRHNIIHKCMTCNKVLFTKRARIKHERLCRLPRTVVRLQTLRCKICLESFKTQRLISQHYKVHGVDRCRICYFLVPEGSILDHLKLNHKEVIHICEICEHISYSTNAAETHITKHHVNPQCTMCLKCFKEPDLKNHMCKFSCLDCPNIPCVHYKYLVSFREQVVSGATKFKCADCDYIYIKRKALIGHANREHLDYHPFTCDHCLQQFYSKVTLKNHLRRYHRESFECEFCDEDFKTKLSLNEHVKICKWITRQFKCSQCVSSFDTPQELEQHKDNKHNIEIYPCSLCNRKFGSNLKLKEHELQIHSGIQIKRKRTNLECTICDIKFVDRKEFTEHIGKHGPGTRFPCKMCNADFDDIKKLHAHARLHGDDVIKCGDCNKLITEAYVAQHMMYCEANRNDEKNTCEVCGKTFQADSILKLHRQIHVDPVTCSVCGKLVKPIYLKRHMKITHGPKKEKKPTKKNSKLIKCDWCGHMVTRHGELESHINRFHLKIKPYECNVCKKQFCGKERLKDHIQTHTKENSCYCFTCGKQFANKVCLKMHMRLHTGLTPYECDTCGEKFRSSSIMKTHKIKKHTEKTVQCPLCDTMFYLAREMRNHFKKVHWKNKGKKFDPREVKEISKEHYYLFEDRRLPKVDENYVFS